MHGSVSILGAGSWGTALAIQSSRNGCKTILWGHDKRHIQNLLDQHINQRYLPETPFPDQLTPVHDLESAISSSPVILLAVPSHAFKTTLKNIQPFLTAEHKIAWATKGFDPEQDCLLHQTTEQVLGKHIETAVISGPTFAREVAMGLPTAVTIASQSENFSSQLSEIFHNQHFRIYTSSDIIGVETGGAVKNVLAIAAGIADGLGFGANTRAALIARGLNEIMRLGLTLGGQSDTFMGLAGLGDLVLTCTDDQSRNRRLGLALGKGLSKEQALQEINQEVEGIFAAREARKLAAKLNIDMPITEQAYQVLYQNLDPKIAVQNLLNREQKPESL